MSYTDKAALSNALFQSTIAEFEEIENTDYPQIEPTEQFKQRIHLSLNGTKKKLSVKWILISFIAAVLVSISLLTVFANTRAAISNFFIRLLGDCYDITVSESKGAEDENDNKTPTPKYIETEYTLAYIEKNNYTKIDKISGNTSITTVWTNGDTIIDLSQFIVDSTASLDSSGDHQILQIGEREVVLSQKFGVYVAIWTEHGYLFSMSCDDVLGIDGVKEIIESLTEIKN